MTCADCKQGAVQAFAFNSPAVAKMWHARCPGGTWCDCQHAVDQTALNPQFVKNES